MGALLDVLAGRSPVDDSEITGEVMRIFDHLDGTPEDAPLSRIAHRMRRSAWWRTVPAYVSPLAVSGEVDSAAVDGLLWPGKREGVE